MFQGHRCSDALCAILSPTAGKMNKLWFNALDCLINYYIFAQPIDFRLFYSNDRTPTTLWSWPHGPKSSYRSKQLVINYPRVVVSIDSGQSGNRICLIIVNKIRKMALWHVMNWYKTFNKSSSWSSCDLFIGQDSNPQNKTWYKLKLLLQNFFHEQKV